jgi:hypothetical protein
VETLEAARRWADTWERSWPTKDAEAIASLYANDATYRSHPLRNPEPGGALGYTRRQFALEEQISCRFATPLVADDRAAVEWWASWVEGGNDVTVVGVTVLRFDGEGRVVEHVDYWVQGDGRQEPFTHWGAGSH